MDLLLDLVKPLAALDGAAPVGWRDILGVAPALVLIGTGVLVLIVDLFLRGWTDDPRPGEKMILHFTALLGTLLAALLAGVSLQAHLAGAEDLFVDTIRVNRFSDAVSVVIILGTFLALFASIDALRRLDLEHGEFPALVLIAAGSLIFFVAATSVIVIFLALETFSLAVYVLCAYTRDDKRSVEGALKYFTLGSFSSAFLLLGFVFLYGSTGETQILEMARLVREGGARVDFPLLSTGLALVFVGLGFKVGAFPFHSWLPDAYEGAPTVVTAFMAVSVKAAGFAVLLKFLAAFPPSLSGEAGSLTLLLLSAVAVLTMIHGNLVALVQSSVKRMLAYSAIAHSGYLLVGAIAASEVEPSGLREGTSAVAPTVFYLFAYGITSLGAFAALSWLGRGKTEPDRFEDFRGMARGRPWTAIALLVLMISLAGIPPTAGFWAKLHVFRQAIETGHWALALIGILTSVVSVYYYARLIVCMYMEAPAPEAVREAAALEARPSDVAESERPSGMVLAFSAATILALGLFPDFLLRFASSLGSP